jgi:hypothetical protein
MGASTALPKFVIPAEAGIHSPIGPSMSLSGEANGFRLSPE